MKRHLIGLAATVGIGLTITVPAMAQKLVQVGWCAPVINTAAAPFAIAQKMGWYAAAGIRVQLVPLPGSTDCVKEVATGDLPYSQPSIEPLAIIRSQGVKAKTFYTAYQSNIYGIAVPVDSPIKDYADLRGKSIGVTTMGSAGVILARALAADAGLDPQKDVRIVVAGEGAQAAVLLRGHQVDALSQFDAAYALIENAGVKLRMLDTSKIIHFPSNGLLALEKTLAERPAEAAAVARGYAMGTVFAFANPEAAVRILWEQYPQTKPMGKDDAAALADGLTPLKARMPSLDLARAGVKRWGESVPAYYDAYVDFLVKWKVVPQKVPASDLVTNDLIDAINQFDSADVTAKAKAYKP
jgi:NitT/TauT family transport system substrate-binding protein